MDTQTQELPQRDELTQTQELDVEQEPQSPQETSPEVPQVSEPKTPKPRFRKTLSFHLLLLFIALSTCVILVLDVAFTAFSYRSAIDDVDQGLIDTADNVRDRYILHAITTADPSTEQYALFSEPDHYIHIHFLTDPFAGSSEGNADAAAEAPQEADATSANTFGTDFVATPTAYTVSAKRSYMLGLPYSDDDDDTDDDDDDDDDTDDDDDDDDYVPPKSTSGTKSNTGTSGNKSNTNTGTSGTKSNTGTSGNKSNTNTGTNKSGTNTGTNKSGTSGSKSGINSGTSKSGTSKLGTNSNRSGTSGNKSGAGNVNIEEIENYVPVGEDPSIYKPPSVSIVLEEGYFIYNQLPEQSVIDQYGLPKDLEGIELSLGEEPQTVEGSSGSQWRAVSVPIRDNNKETIGYVVLARPLEPVIDSVHKTSLYLGLFGLGIVALGSLLAYYLIRRSLRTLNSISESTHAIAAGDLTQRVPSGPKGSEVGMLSDSINVMLGQIEHSFDMKEQSEAKMRQFVSDASHELRTPLTTVRGYAELFRMGGVPRGEMEHTMGRIESEAKRMGVLVEDLLQLARLDEARPMNFQTLDASDIANTVLNDFQVRDPEREVRLVGLDGGEAVPTLIDGDKDKIEQVITNLLSNVQTHTPAGTPVELAVGTAYAPSVGPDGLPSQQVLVEVRDHGAGVPEAEREKIFERFFRTDSSRSRNSGGSGLGLSIVSSVMQAHGGYAQALETDGGGLTVRLAFPTAPVPAAPVAPVAA